MPGARTRQMLLTAIRARSRAEGSLSDDERSGILSLCRVRVVFTVRLAFSKVFDPDAIAAVYRPVVTRAVVFVLPAKYRIENFALPRAPRIAKVSEAAPSFSKPANTFFFPPPRRIATDRR